MKRDMLESDMDTVLHAKFDALFRRYYLEIRGYITGMYPDHADDLVQDTFMTLFNKLETIDEATVRAWLYRVATNKGIDLARSHQRKPTLSEEDSVGEVKQDTETQAMVRLVMQRLEPRHEQILNLYGAGLSYQEMADILNVKTTSISQLLLRAKRAFEHHMGILGNQQK